MVTVSYPVCILAPWRTLGKEIKLNHSLYPPATPRGRLIYKWRTFKIIILSFFFFFLQTTYFSVTFSQLITFKQLLDNHIWHFILKVISFLPYINPPKWNRTVVPCNRSWLEQAAICKCPCSLMKPGQPQAEPWTPTDKAVNFPSVKGIN